VYLVFVSLLYVTLDIIGAINNINDCCIISATQLSHSHKRIPFAITLLYQPINFGQLKYELVSTESWRYRLSIVTGSVYNDLSIGVAPEEERKLVFATDDI